MPKLNENSLDATLLETREHPFYLANKAIWARNMAAYGGGFGYIAASLIRHISEPKEEYAERLRRACYTNYPRRIANLITQYVLARRPEREDADPEIVEDFSRTGMRVDEVMRQVATYLTVCGCAWLAVDMPAFDGVRSLQQQRQERLRPYGVALSPLDVPDWHYADDGQLDWVLMREKEHDNSDPCTQPHQIDIRKLWTRDEVAVMRHDRTSGERTLRIIPHGLGCVPFIRQQEVDGYGIRATHWFEDVVRISDTILNYNSEAGMNVVKQMFGLLIVPEDFIASLKQRDEEEKDAGKDTAGELTHVLARSAAIVESPEGKGCTRYISPSGAETAAIRAEIEALRHDMYSTVGLAVSKDNTRLVESAEAKAWDFQGVEQYMATRADMLEQCECLAWRMMNAWDSAIPVPKVYYNRNFAIMDMEKSVQTLLQLSGFNQGNGDYQREIGKTAVQLLNRIRQLPQDTVEGILEGIEKQETDADLALRNAVLAGAAAASQGDAGKA